MNCKHTGCNAPESECSGECMAKAAESFEQMALRIGYATKGTGDEIFTNFAHSIRSELAKQAGSVEPVAWYYANTVAKEPPREDLKEYWDPIYPATALAAQAAKLAELQDEIAKLKPDAERLDEIASEYLIIEPFERPTGGDDADVGWRALQHHCGELKPRVVAEVFEDDPRKAIDAARNAK